MGGASLGHGAAASAGRRDVQVPQRECQASAPPCREPRGRSVASLRPSPSAPPQPGCAGPNASEPRPRPEAAAAPSGPSRRHRHRAAGPRGRSAQGRGAELAGALAPLAADYRLDQPAICPHPGRRPLVNFHHRGDALGIVVVTTHIAPDGERLSATELRLLSRRPMTVHLRGWVAGCGIGVTPDRGVDPRVLPAATTVGHAKIRSNCPRRAIRSGPGECRVPEELSPW